MSLKMGWSQYTSDEERGFGVHFFLRHVLTGPSVQFIGVVPRSSGEMSDVTTLQLAASGDLCTLGQDHVAALCRPPEAGNSKGWSSWTWSSHRQGWRTGDHKTSPRNDVIGKAIYDYIYILYVVHNIYDVIGKAESLNHPFWKPRIWGSLDIIPNRGYTMVYPISNIFPTWGWFMALALPQP
jgi:hypothetical protein